MFLNEDGTKTVSNPKAASRASSHQPAWTAKRCSRLLRPLASRLGLLRRRQEQSLACQTHPKRVSTSSGTIPIATTATTPEQQENVYRIGSEVSDVQLNFSQIQDQDAAGDPDWVPMQERLKLKRKYSAFASNRGGAGISAAGIKRSTASMEKLRKGRPRCVETARRAPGEIVVPTPIIARSAKIIVEGVDTLPDEPGQRYDSVIEEESFKESPKRTALVDSMVSSPQHLKRQRQKGLLQGRLAQKLKSLKANTCSELYVLLEGLFQALDNLLQATTSQKPRNDSIAYQVVANEIQRKKGSRSLLATCVRVVPGYIALEEEWQRDENDSDDEIDVTAEVYAELEAFGSCEGQGWSHLRETVRAHGMNLLCSTIRDGVISCLIADQNILNLFFKSLISICSANEASAEAEMLLNAIIEVQKSSKLGIGAGGHDCIPIPPSISKPLFEAPTNGILSMVRTWAARSDRPYTLYNMLIKLLNSNKMPISWLATQSFMDEIWPAAIKSLSNIDQNYVGAVNLLETSIIRCCGVMTEDSDTGDNIEPQKSLQHGRRSTMVTGNCYQIRNETASEYLEDALNNTIFSLCTVMSSVVLASISETNHQAKSGSPSFLWAMGYFSTQFFRQLAKQQNVGRQSLLDKHYLTRITTVITANIIIAAELPDYLPNLKDLLVVTEEYLYHNSTKLHDSKYNSDLPDGSNNIIYAIASCCARAAASDGFEHFRSTISAVLKFTLTISSLRYTTWYMKKVCLEAAVAFAEHSECASHAAYAHEIERTLGTLESVRSRKPKTGAKSSIDGGGRTNDSSGGTQSKADVTPSRPSLVSQTPSQQRSSMRGFRWEEGICEWIAATPASMFLPRRPAPTRDHNLTKKRRRRSVEQRSDLIIRPDYLESQARDVLAVSNTKPERELKPTLLPSSPSSLLPNNGQGRTQSRHITTCLPTRSGPRLVLSSVDVNVNMERKRADNHQHGKVVKLAREPETVMQYQHHQQQSKAKAHCANAARPDELFSQRRRRSLRQQQQKKRDSGVAFSKASDCNNNNNNNNNNASGSESSDYNHDDGDDELCTLKICPPTAVATATPTATKWLSTFKTSISGSTRNRDRRLKGMKKRKATLRRNIPRRARQINLSHYA